MSIITIRGSVHFSTSSDGTDWSGPVDVSSLDRNAPEPLSIEPYPIWPQPLDISGTTHSTQQQLKRWRKLIGLPSQRRERRREHRRTMKRGRS